MEVFGETRAFDIVVPGKAAKGRSINFGAMTDAFLAHQSRVRRDVDGGNHPFVASTGESMKAGLGVASICPTKAVDVAANEDPTTEAVIMVGDEEPQQSQIRIEAGFCLNQAQWDFLAGHKMFGSFKDDVGDLARQQSPVFCEVKVPINEQVTLYGSNGLQALCSLRGKRCYNRGYCRLGSCPTVNYQLVYTELFYHMLASELELKQH